jgi:hypothetical protein
MVILFWLGPVSRLTALVAQAACLLSMLGLIAW